MTKIKKKETKGEFVWVLQGRTEHAAHLVPDSRYCIDEDTDACMVTVEWVATGCRQDVEEQYVRKEESRRRRRRRGSDTVGHSDTKKPKTRANPPIVSSPTPQSLPAILDTTPKNSSTKCTTKLSQDSSQAQETAAPPARPPQEGDFALFGNRVVGRVVGTCNFYHRFQHIPTLLQIRNASTFQFEVDYVAVDNFVATPNNATVRKRVSLAVAQAAKEEGAFLADVAQGQQQG